MGWGTIEKESIISLSLTFRIVRYLPTASSAISTASTASPATTTAPASPSEESTYRSPWIWWTVSVWISKRCDQCANTEIMQSYISNFLPSGLNIFECLQHHNSWKKPIENGKKPRKSPWLFINNTTVCNDLEEKNIYLIFWSIS